MKVRAVTSFAGADVSMYAGEVCDIPAGAAAPLLECGYVAEEKKTAKKQVKDNETG